MKLIKKILRIICIILPAFGFIFLLPQSASAKSYQINKIPFGVEDRLSWQNFRVRFDYNGQQICNGSDCHNISTSDMKTKDLRYWVGKYEDNKCKYDFGANALSFDTSGLSYSYRYYIPDFLLYYSNSDLASCNYQGPRYRPDNFPAYAFGTPNYAAWAGYRYQYDGLYLTDCDAELSSRCSTYDMSDLFTPLPTVWNEINLPLGMPETNVENIVVNTPIRFEGSFWFDSGYGSFTTFDFTPMTFQLRVEGYTSEVNLQNDVKAMFNIPCSWTHSTGAADTPEAGNEYYYFVCDRTSPFTFYNNYYYMTLQLVGASSNNGILIEASPAIKSFVLSDFYLILNNDLSNGGAFSDTVRGGETQYAPNSIKSPENSPSQGGGGAAYRDSWEYKLQNLFNFSLFNPFKPIFDMFQNSQDCHHIPIIAGMLNVEDDEYCPWFPATVRQITTPVISIAATMLLFGFFISFLKSGSGNDTIDTGGRNLEIKK